VVFGDGISLSALLALLAPVTTAPATGPIPIRVDVEAPAGCADADAFFASLLARMDRATRAKDGDDAVRVKVRISRAGAKVHGELRMIRDQGASDTRKVDGATCGEVVEVLSLTAAIALDPSARLAGGAATATPPPAVAAPATASPSPAAASSSPAPAPAGIAPPAPAAPVPPRAAPAPPAPPTAATPAPAITAPAPAPAPGLARRFGFHLGAHAAMANVVSPTVSLGGALAARLTSQVGDGAESSIGVSLLYLPNDFIQPAGDVVVTWTALALTACPGWAIRGHIAVVEACALGIAGWLDATDRAVTNPRSASRSWWSAGAILRARVALGGGFAADLEAGVSAPLVERRFVTTTPLRTVGNTPSLSALVGLGISRRL
jgi:hypothetical protein